MDTNIVIVNTGNIGVMSVGDQVESIDQVWSGLGRGVSHFCLIVNSLECSKISPCGAKHLSRLV